MTMYVRVTMRSGLAAAFTAGLVWTLSPSHGYVQMASPFLFEKKPNLLASLIKKKNPRPQRKVVRVLSLGVVQAMV